MSYAISSISMSHDDSQFINRVIRGFTQGALFAEFLPEPEEIANCGDEKIWVPNTHPGAIFHNFMKVPDNVAAEAAKHNFPMLKRRAWRCTHWGAAEDVGRIKGDRLNRMWKLSANHVELRFVVEGDPPLRMFDHWSSIGYDIFANIDDEEGWFSLVYANGRLASVPTKAEIETSDYENYADYRRGLCEEIPD